MADALKLYGTELGARTYWVVWFSLAWLLLSAGPNHDVSGVGIAVLYPIAFVALFAPFRYVLANLDEAFERSSLASLGTQFLFVGGTLGVTAALVSSPVHAIEPLLAGAFLLAGGCLLFAGRTDTSVPIGWRALTGAGYVVVGVGLSVAWLLLALPPGSQPLVVYYVSMAVVSAWNCVVGVEIMRESGRYPIESAVHGTPASPVRG